MEEALLFQAKMRMTPKERLSEAVRTTTVRDVMERWLATKTEVEKSTQKAYRLEADGIIATWGDHLAATMDKAEVVQWSRRADGPGSSIRRRQVVALKAAFRHAADPDSRSSILVRDPLATVSLPKATKRDPRFLNWDQLEDLARASGHYAPLVWVLGTCGLRLEEAARLDVADIDRHKKALLVRKSRTGAGRNRRVPVDSEVLAMLPSAPGPAFRSPAGGRLSGHNWREREFKPTAFKVFGFEMVPHELRHAAASLAIDAGADAVKVANMLGHADPSTTYRISPTCSRPGGTTWPTGWLKRERLRGLAECDQLAVGTYVRGPKIARPVLIACSAIT